ncbi:MerR family transcriptional regulator [Brevibacterium spongiae]|uniref:MerR family transcriptional regulator n=1 Tax=Brevibacterium spongiae TaxID=2909672 RepID=A0ABY5SST4_9MICO|nr:MerR family transcriptional regulator [Brevibacterium spongiae]UVI36166.1 MerR family transcriptional regulator [Brevibacterium spongiae]
MKIGEFARLGQVSVRMLRHYESLGLLIPNSVDRFTGHRSYTVGQLLRLNRIMALNALGISLRKVSELLDAQLSTSALSDMLNLRRHQLRAEQTAAAAKLAEVEFRLTLIERTTMDHPDCIIKDLPAERVLGRALVLGEPPFDTTEIGPLFGEVATTLAEAGTRHGVGVGLYTDTGHGTEVTCGYRVDTGQEISNLHFTELPSAEAATLIHEGSMSHIGASWQHLSEWCLTQGYSLSGPCREVYLETDADADGSDGSGWVVELQQPIAR